jgi:hypothetical protein
LKIPAKTKYLIFISLLIIPLLFYWLKVQVGINIFNSYSISTYFPFKYLYNDVIESPEPGILLSEDFDRKRIFRIFTLSWIKENGLVTDEISPYGIKGSRCLLIKSNSNGYWVYSHRKKVKVRRGDLFNFEGLVRMTGGASHAWLSVVAFDENNEAIDWNLFKSKTDKKGEWIKVEKQFDIPDDNIRYIRFRLVGKGHGEFQFDNIVFRKLNYSDN